MDEDNVCQQIDHAVEDSNNIEQQKESGCSGSSQPVETTSSALLPSMAAAKTRKLCIRHQRMADEGTSLKLQQSLDALPVQERESINAIWSTFSSSPHPTRELILQGLLTMCCFSQLSLLTEQLAHLIRIDPFAVVLPRELALHILANLDATSLCRAAQVSRLWRSLADDDTLWKGICEQHIGQKCAQCGWGLPVLEAKRLVAHPPPSLSPSSSSPSSSPSPSPSCPGSPVAAESTPGNKRRNEEEGSWAIDRPSKRQRSEPRKLPPSDDTDPATLCSPPELHHHHHHLHYHQQQASITRPWKDVYRERLTIERNWRRGRCTVRTLKGHTDGVMCLQFAETLAPHWPACPPILITGSYDRTVRVWNLETGTELRRLHGHTRAVRALQFDAAKLITGSMDGTIKVWDWREGRCVRTLVGHEGGVVCLNFDSNVLASGGVDAKVKVWNLRTQEAFTLRGHADWVNAVQLWDSNGSCVGGTADDASVSVFEPGVPSAASEPRIDPGKMLFSASDDGTIRLWDLTNRSCVKRLTGHVAQVQSMRLLFVDEECVGSGGGEGKGEERSEGKMASTSSLEHVVGSFPSGTLSSEFLASNASNNGSRLPVVCSGSDSPPPGSHVSSSSSSYPTPPVPIKMELISRTQPPLPPPQLKLKGKETKRRRNPILITGSLDNTIKLWDIGTGNALKTFFGHIEGVWAVASDKLRLVSGSHDRTIKVWTREEGRCTSTLVGHRGAVTCLALGEDKIVSGSDDGDVRIWSFGESG